MQTNAQGIEHLSLITTPILLLQGNVVISQGTGFYYILEDSTKGNIIFLVTNYHVLTGNSPNTDKPPKGDNIKFYFHKDPNNPGEVNEISIPLFTKEKKKYGLQVTIIRMQMLLLSQFYPPLQKEHLFTQLLSIGQKVT